MIAAQPKRVAQVYNALVSRCARHGNSPGLEPIKPAVFEADPRAVISFSDFLDQQLADPLNRGRAS